MSHIPPRAGASRACPGWLDSTLKVTTVAIAVIGGVWTLLNVVLVPRTTFDKEMTDIKVQLSSIQTRLDGLGCPPVRPARNEARRRP